MEVFFEIFFPIITSLIGFFPIFMFIFIIVAATKASSANNGTNNSSAHVSRNYNGITRAGVHQHPGSVGTTKKDDEWEQTRCGKYKDEIFGKDVCNRYIKPDYDSLTCEDEDLSGR